MPLTGMCPHCLNADSFSSTRGLGHPLPLAVRRRRHGECGHGFPPCGQAASSVTACFHLISPSFSPYHLWASATVSLPALYGLLEELTAVVLCVPAGIRLHVWLAQRALAQPWRQPAYSPRVAHPPFNTHLRLDTLGLPFVVPCRPHVCGPPGPKSRDHSTLAGRWLHCLVLSFMITPSRAVIDARVPASARDAGGAASASGWLTHVAAKPSGRSEATCVSQPIDQNLRIRKRTFRRAVARAARTGGAYYKGRWRSAQHFGVPVAASDIPCMRLPPLAHFVLPNTRRLTPHPSLSTSKS